MSQSPSLVEPVPDHKNAIAGKKPSCSLLKLLLSAYNRRTIALEAELFDKRQQIKDLEAQIEIDPLVNVLNRRGFFRELNRAIADSCDAQTSAALVFIDLDNFKSDQ